MKESKSIQTYNFNDPASLINMGSTLKEHIVKQKLYVDVKGKNYVLVEGWQFAGGLTGVFPVVKSLEDISKDKVIKYKATVELLHKGTVVGSGIAICSNAEKGKTSFDEFAIASMAQTRAVGKAYRFLFGFVMKSVGYEATPYEDMIIDIEPDNKKFEKIKKIAQSFKGKSDDQKNEFLETYKTDLSEEELEEIKNELA